MERIQNCLQPRSQLVLFLGISIFSAMTSVVALILIWFGIASYSGEQGMMAFFSLSTVRMLWISDSSDVSTDCTHWIVTCANFVECSNTIVVR